MDSNQFEQFKQEISGTGTGEGLHSYIINQNGLIITGSISIDQNLVGIHCDGTDERLNYHQLEWRFQVYTQECLLVNQERSMTIQMLREQGLVQENYEEIQRECLIAMHRYVLFVKLTPPVQQNAKEIVSQSLDQVTNLQKFEQNIQGSGKGAGCHSYPINQNGLKIAALVSIDENFVGVNCNGTDQILDDSTIYWDLRVFDNKQLVAQDKRQMSVKQLRSLGSLGAFYGQSHRKSLIDFHRVDFAIKFNPQENENHKQNEKLEDKKDKCDLQ